MASPADLEDSRECYKKTFTDYLKIAFHGGTFVNMTLEKRTLILICEDADNADVDSQPVTKKPRNAEENDDNETSTINLNPNVKQVKKISGKVVLTTLYQPWVDLGASYISKCCGKGPDECESIHRRSSCNQEGEIDDKIAAEFFKDMNPTKADQFLRCALSGGSYPLPQIVQYILLKNLCPSEEHKKNDVFCLNKLLALCPPCDNSKVNYYKKILFGPVEYLSAPDGVFWWCIYMIEDFMKALVKEKNKLISSDFNNLLSTTCSLQDLSEYARSAHSSRENTMNEILAKLTHLFYCLDFMLKVMEGDLTMGLLKGITNLSHYACGVRKPFIAMAFWDTNSEVGTMNAKIRHMMKLYFKIYLLCQGTDYPKHFRRLISLIAGATYASQRNVNPPVFPNIRDNCKSFASNFAYIMLQTRLSLSKVLEILKALRPTWLQFLVSSFLIDVLDGRREYETLNSLCELLEDLGKENQDFPSSEEISTILLRDSSDTYIKHGKMPRKLFCKLAVLTPLAIALQIRLTGISRLDRNLDHNIQFATGVRYMQFNHPSLKNDYSELRHLNELVFSQQNEKGLADTLTFLFD